MFPGNGGQEREEIAGDRDSKFGSFLHTFQGSVLFSKTIRSRRRRKCGGELPVPVGEAGCDALLQRMKTSMNYRYHAETGVDTLIPMSRFDKAERKGESYLYSI